jgi:hypothetical protein
MTGIIVYLLFAYGITNLLVYGTGPFEILVKFRIFSRRILNTLGDMLDCMMCTSTNIGWIVSLLNILFISVPLTPMMILYGSFLPWYVIIFGDACITSGAVWILHTCQEMMERIGSNSDE